MCHWGFSPRRDTGLLVHNQDNPKGSLWETIMGVRWSSIFVGILWGHFLQPGLSQLQYLPSKDSGLAVPSKKGDHERQGGQPSTRSKATPLGSSPETLPSPMFLPKKAAGHTEGKTIVLSFFFFFFFFIIVTEKHCCYLISQSILKIVCEGFWTIWGGKKRHSSNN